MQSLSVSTNLRSHVLQQSMRQVNDSWHQCTQTLINQIREMSNGFLLTHLQTELFLNLHQIITIENDLQHSLIRFKQDIRNIRIHHQTEQIQDQIRTLP